MSALTLSCGFIPTISSTRYLRFPSFLGLKYVLLYLIVPKLVKTPVSSFLTISQSFFLIPHLRRYSSISSNTSVIIFLPNSNRLSCRPKTKSAKSFFSLMKFFIVSSIFLVPNSLKCCKLLYIEDSHPFLLIFVLNLYLNRMVSSFLFLLLLFPYNPYCNFTLRSIRDILKQLCNYKGVEIIEGHLMPDHIHMLVSIPPKMSISSFMRYLKGKSALMIFDKHANLKYNYGNRHFWAEGYYVDTVGRTV
ncbi:hypothetical protein SDC9_127350 [bioreactor metagenome]|uniref:Transposase IS200-like domain-containing protein n=1 Tax=bioreactor metagenome TaxID=1076179 RepID=A0A645CTR3_9ZZZZ